jgi:hypothetical protein
MTQRLPRRNCRRAASACTSDEATYSPIDGPFCGVTDSRGKTEHLPRAAHPCRSKARNARGFFQLRAGSRREFPTVTPTTGSPGPISALIAAGLIGALLPAAPGIPLIFGGTSPGNSVLRSITVGVSAWIGLLQHAGHTEVQGS